MDLRYILDSTFTATMPQAFHSMTKTHSDTFVLQQRSKSANSDTDSGLIVCESEACAPNSGLFLTGLTYRHRQAHKH